MRMKDRYPQAHRWTQNIVRIRREIEALTECKAAAASIAQRVSSLYGPRAGKGTASREDYMCKSIDASAEIARLQTELDAKLAQTDKLLCEFDDPSAALLLRMLYVYNADRTIVRLTCCMSLSCFYERLRKGMQELETLLNRRAAA